MTVRITTSTQLSNDQIEAVLALIGEATAADGVTPFSEHTRLHLRHADEQATPTASNVLAFLAADPAAGPVGYAHFDRGDALHPPSAELAVDPGFRRRGIGTALLDEIERQSDDGNSGDDHTDPRSPAADRTLRVWAHGRRPGAVAFAASRGYTEERALWLMRRSLAEPLPDLVVPEGIRIRPFVVGQDEQAWTEVNNRAFAHHREQSGWSVEDVRVREREPWFDPAGFLLAERASDGAVVGFHWTKVHPTSAHAGTPTGEVYVVGVDPAAQGLRLGSALTLAGLHHLRDLGLDQVILYVDEPNTAAITVYTRLGFTRADVDVQFARPSRTAPADTGYDLTP